MASKMGIINNRKLGMGRCNSEKLKAANINGIRMAIPMKNPTETNLTKLPKLIPDFVILIFIFFLNAAGHREPYSWANR
jgi:hypothetical protein